jgi:hypothetical protein
MNRNKLISKMNLQFFAASGRKPRTIFDLVTAGDITAYWEEKIENTIPYLGEELWTSQQKLGLKLEWIKGASGLPVVLKPSAYDAVAQKRDRIGFEKLEAEMPFFKESMYINEELRQQLNMVLETGNQAYINTIVNNIFNDEINLLDGARAQRERIRMMALTTGYVSISANGQSYDYDYGIPDNHKIDVTANGGKAWSDPDATIVDDIRDALDTIENDTGVRPTRGVYNRSLMKYLRKNNEIRQAINGSDSTAPVSDTKIRSYIIDELNVEIVPYSKKYKNEAGVETNYVEDDILVLFPDGILGTGWFGTTPEQSDLMSGTAANVSITDTGVAVTTSKKVDPVNVDTKVSMIYLPDFPTADQVAIMDIA